VSTVRRAWLQFDGKGVPVLLRHYLSLGARIAEFNVDDSFASVLDALIVVDLLRTPPRTLAKYMGREECAHWLNHHGAPHDDQSVTTWAT
jgi:hypothetical protein